MKGGHEVRSWIRSVMVIGVATVAMAAAAAACSSDSDSGSGDESELEPEVAALEGRYAHFDVVAYQDDIMKVHIISYGFTDLDVVDNELVATESFCFSEFRSDQPIEIEMPDVATQAIVPDSAAVTVSMEGDTIRLSRPPTPTPLGVRLENPATDPLPTDPNDPRLSDDDNDGNPGVTVKIMVSPELSGEIYISRREIFAYDVELQEDGSLTGTVTDESEQLIIGASDPSFITDGQWVQNPDLALSPIILEPVERSWDCDQLQASRDEMFPPTPEVDW